MFKVAVSQYSEMYKSILSLVALLNAVQINNHRWTFELEKK